MNGNASQQQHRLNLVLGHLSPNIQRVMALHRAMNESQEQKKWMGNKSEGAAQVSRYQRVNENSSSSSSSSSSSNSNSNSNTDSLLSSFKPSLITYLSAHELVTQESLQAGVLLVAHPRSDVRRQFIKRLCQAAVEKSALVYAIAPAGSLNVEVEGVYTLSTHPTLSRRAILNALLRHGAHLLVFGTIGTRDDVMALMDATYTGYHCVAEIYGESAHDVLSRLEAIGVDVSMLPQNLRVIVPTMEKL